jgi:hypothetical protein
MIFLEMIENRQSDFANVIFLTEKVLRAPLLKLSKSVMNFSYCFNLIHLFANQVVSRQFHALTHIFAPKRHDKN